MGTPGLRLRGRGERVRLSRVGAWDRDELADLRVVCRASVAVDKMLGESVARARAAGRSWQEIGRALGVAPEAQTWDQVAAGLAQTRLAALDLNAPGSGT